MTSQNPRTHLYDSQGACRDRPGVHGHLEHAKSEKDQQEQTNDQIDRRRLCLNRLNFRAGCTSRAASTAGRHDTQVREACGAGMHMVNGTCMRTATRRNAARCAVGMRTVGGRCVK